MTKRINGRLLALVLAGWLLIAPVLAAVTDTPAEFEAEFDMDGPFVTITSVEEFLAFAQYCALDTWSQGKTVELAADLDLSGEEFTPIPTFGGIFLGGEHTISGLSITSAGSAQGLFRQIQPTGMVQDLTVEGAVVPGGTRSIVGGIVGDNSGTLQNCTFRGTVEGDSMVGGIAGRNNAEGMLIECYAFGSVNGRSAAGGIAGCNTGQLMTCENNAEVNLTQTESMDTGGIAGWSTGTVQGCINNGAVGSAHVGYNVGGIAGRQSGYLSECVNSGAVSGRKDVGGIVGQGEPYLLIDPQEDAIERLRRELDALDELIGQAIDDAQDTSDDISARLKSMGSYTDTARSNSQVLLDQISSVTNVNASAGSTLVNSLSSALRKITPAVNDLSDAGGRLEQLAAELSGALDTAGVSDQAGAGLRTAADGLSQAGSRLTGAVDSMERALDQVEDGDDDEQQAALDQLEDGASELEDASVGLTTALGTLDSVQDDLSGSALLEKLRDVSDSAAEIGTVVRQSADTISSALSGLSGGIGVQFTSLGNQYRQAGTGLINAMGSLSSEMARLNTAASNGTDALMDDLRLINNQFRTVIDVMMDAMEDMSKSPEDRLADMLLDTSEEDAAAVREGKVANCENTGPVDGDKNVGGAVGAMGMEFELDPEEDAASYLSFGAAYETRAVLESCINYGSVIAKEDCVGGLVGRMDLGTALSCESYGSVESTGGDYAGGVAGWADAAVRSCWAKCAVSGVDYVGGVAGWASSLRDCCAIATITGGNERVGAIAGDAQEDGVLSGNCFLDTGVAGVDGVSYTGQAEPVSFDAISWLAGVPEAFTTFAVTLRADGETVAQIPFFYGDDLSLLELPQVPRREGSYGVWPEFDTSGTHDVVLDAVYSPWITVLASVEQAGRLSLVLAEGQFTGDAVLHVEEITGDLSRKKDNESAAWNVTITGSTLGAAEEVPLRLLSPNGGNADVWQYVDGEWTPISVERNGQYLLVTMTGSQGAFFIQPRHTGWIILAVIVVIAGLVIIVLAAWRLIQARKRKGNGPSPFKPF